MAACEQLSRAGYKEVAWVNGGFDTARKEDLPVVNAPDLRYGGIGGLSEFLGWTDAQRQNSQSEGFIGGFQNVLKLVHTRHLCFCHVNSAYSLKVAYIMSSCCLVVRECFIGERSVIRVHNTDPLSCFDPILRTALVMTVNISMPPKTAQSLVHGCRRRWCCFWMDSGLVTTSFSSCCTSERCKELLCVVE